MSCFKGQAIYPTIFDGGYIPKTGYLSLSLLRGVLEFEGHRYTVVRGRDDGDEEVRPRRDLLSEEVDRPLNSCPNSRALSWKLEAGDRFLGLGVCLGSGAPIASIRDPFIVMSTLASSLVAGACPHDRGTPLQTPDTFCDYTSPANPFGYQGGQRTLVVASDGADHLRFYSLAGLQVRANGVNAVVRIDACLECCLDLCRKADCKFLIL
jgi:hypothetical protein